MLYHSFYLEPVEWIGERVRENIQAVIQPVYAGLYLPDLSPIELERAMRDCRRRGASGVSLFGDLTEEHWQSFEAALG